MGRYTSCPTIYLTFCKRLGVMCDARHRLQSESWRLLSHFYRTVRLLFLRIRSVECQGKIVRLVAGGTTEARSWVGSRRKVVIFRHD